MNKFDQFEACVYDLNPDIIGITESWADSHVLDSELAMVTIFFGRIDL